MPLFENRMSFWEHHIKLNAQLHVETRLAIVQRDLRNLTYSIHAMQHGLIMYKELLCGLA